MEPAEPAEHAHSLGTAFGRTRCLASLLAPLIDAKARVRIRERVSRYGEADGSAAARAGGEQYWNINQRRRSRSKLKLHHMHKLIEIIKIYYRYDLESCRCDMCVPRYYIIILNYFRRKHVLKLTVITLYFQGRIQQLPIMQTGEGGNMNISIYICHIHGLPLTMASYSSRPFSDSISE